MIVQGVGVETDLYGVSFANLINKIANHPLLS